MKQKVADYTVIIKKETRLGTKTACYSAYVPLLGIGTEASSIKKVQDAIKSLVEFHLEALTAEGEKIPMEKEASIIATLSALLPKNAQIASN